MKVVGRSSRQSERCEEFAEPGSRPIGGTREFATFALLAFCFAVTVAVVFGRGHRAVNAAGARSQPAVAAHRAIAPNPRSHAHAPAAAPIASGQDNTARDFTDQDYTAWVSTAAVNVGNAAESVEGVVLQTLTTLVWDPALSLSNQMVGFVADSWVNPVTGDRLIFDAAPGAAHMAVTILAFAMLAVVMLALTGPLYASWKTWRLSRANSGRGRSH